jgi:hypothetical protein
LELINIEKEITSLFFRYLSSLVCGHPDKWGNNGTNKLQVFDLGGEYTQSLEAGSAEFGTLSVDTGASIVGNTSIGGGLNVGGAAQLSGNLGVGGSVLFQNTTNSTTAFQVQNATVTINYEGLRMSKIENFQILRYNCLKEAYK